MTRFDPGLDAFFLMLQEADIAVGLAELARLKRVFTLMPHLDDVALGRVLEAMLVKSVEQRGDFRRIYRKWLDIADAQLDAIEIREERKRRQKMHDAVAPALLTEDDAGESMAADELAPSDRAEKRLQRKRKVVSLSGPQPASQPDETRPPIPATQSLAPADSASIARVDAEPVRPEPGHSQPIGAQSQLPSQGESRELPSGAGPSKRISWGTWAGLIAAITAVLVVTYAMIPLDSGRDSGDAGQISPNGDDNADGGATEFVNPPQRADKTAEFARAEVAVEPYLAPPLSPLGLGLIILSAGLAVLLWQRFGRGKWLPLPAVLRLPRPAVVISPGPALTIRADSEALLLDASDEQTLVWGVGRFVSDQDSRDLDIERTVAETAAAFGRPVLRYQAARFQREVWLWVDESIDSPVARHLARDLATMLERAGLPVLRAEFWGIPDKLRTEKDEILLVDALDARRDSVAVAILTDGRIMDAANRARDRRVDLQRVLRDLSHWPRVTMIDFGRESGQLEALVAEYGLRVIQPRESAAAVSDLAADSSPAEYGELVGDARVWAAICALSPRPVDDRTALSLRRILGLDASPWVIETLRETAASSAGGLRFSATQRAELLGWLRQAEELPDDLGRRRRFGLLWRTGSVTLPPDCVLARATAAWSQVLDERERAQQRRDPTWEDSLAAAESALERAFIQLWARPNQAAAALYQLHEHGRLRRTVRHYLQSMAPLEYAGRAATHPGLTIMPWRFAHLHRNAQVQLTAMGFAARAEMAGPRSLPRPGRLYVALGLCVGLCLGGVAALVDHHMLVDKPAPTVPESGSVAGGEVVSECRGPDSSQHCVVTVRPLMAGTDDRVQVVERRVEMGESAAVSWDAIRLPCGEELADGQVQLRRCTADDQPPPRPLGAPWSFAVIYLDQNEQLSNYGKALADELLSSGSVHALYTLTAPPSTLMNTLPLDTMARQRQDNSNDQLLIIVPNNKRDPGRLGNLLAPYNGSAVVIAVDELGDLQGISEEFDNTRTLREIIDKRAEQRSGVTVDPVLGTLDDFAIRGIGPCGADNQRCCRNRGVEPCASDELSCQEGVCRAQATVCVYPNKRCDGDEVQVCQQDGQGWETLDVCTDGRRCQSRDGDARCVTAAQAPTDTPRVCQPGQVRCDRNGLARTVCNRAGTAVTRQTCAPGQLCQNALCRRIDRARVRFQSVTGIRQGTLSCFVNSTPANDMPLNSGRLPGRDVFTTYRSGADALLIGCRLDSAGTAYSGQVRRPWNLDAEGIGALLLHSGQDKNDGSGSPGVQRWADADSDVPQDADRPISTNSAAPANPVRVEYTIDILLAP